MTFSIVIPMYNSAKTIEKAFYSCIEQTLAPLEIIIIDDGSSDISISIVKYLKKNYIGDIHIIIFQFGINTGPSRARNKGWSLAKGEYIAFLDADDYFINNKLESLLEILQSKEDIILLGHRAALHDQEYKINVEVKEITIFELLKENFSTTPSVIIKREISERFDEGMHYTEDHDLWLRVTDKYHSTYFYNNVLTIINRPVLSKGGQSSNLWEMRKGELVMYKKYCMRKSRIWKLPFLVLFSLSKHFYKWVR